MASLPPWSLPGDAGMDPYSVIVFGASGAIGQAIAQWHLDRDCAVTGVARHVPADPASGIRWLAWDPAEAVPAAVADLPPASFDAAIWAQGANLNDSIRGFDAAAHERLYRANVLYILQSLSALLDREVLAPTARIAIVSSIWQNIARPNKLSYGVTKAAIQGLVQSLSIDLGAEGKLVNAVLPGALDTPMTRANLSTDQIGRLEAMTPLATLPTLADVCNLTGFLCSPQNTGITGQFIAADRGFSFAKML